MTAMTPLQNVATMRRCPLHRALALGLAFANGSINTSRPSRATASILHLEILRRGSLGQLRHFESPAFHILTLEKPGCHGLWMGDKLGIRLGIV